VAAYYDKITLVLLLSGRQNQGTARLLPAGEFRVTCTVVLTPTLQNCRRKR
jgi:hypothetical protein